MSGMLTEAVRPERSPASSETRMPGVDIFLDFLVVRRLKSRDMIPPVSGGGEGRGGRERERGGREGGRGE